MAQRGKRYTNEQINEVTRQLRARALTLAVDLFPDRRGYRSGNYFFPVNHTRNDRHPGSMYIHLTGEKAGGFYENVGDIGGGPLQLIALARGFDRRRDFPKIMKFATEWLGLDLPEPTEVTTHAPASVKHIPRNPEETAKWIKGLWLRGSADLSHKIVTDYFKGERDLDLGALSRPPGSVRFDAAARYYTAPREWHAQPALLTLMLDSEFRPAALHRTYLTADGQKYHGDDGDMSAKKMLGRAKGAFAPVSRGEGDVRFSEAIRHGVSNVYAITEGLEDALTVAYARPDWRVLMAGTLGNIGQIPFLPHMEALHIIAQNDEHIQARKSFAKAITALGEQAKGRKLLVHPPPASVKDFNEYLQTISGGA